jgi:N utilization substance protein A
VSEGFETMEEVGYVAIDDLTSIEGFDAETAEELQTRAREYLEKIAAEQDEKRRAAGVHDNVLEIEGVTLPMAVKFGENEVLSVEDVAGLVPDDLRGYTEVKNGEKVHEDGMLEEFKLSEENATALIMRARVKAGWIDESDLLVTEEDKKEEVPTVSPELTAEDVFG